MERCIVVPTMERWSVWVGVGGQGRSGGLGGGGGGGGGVWMLLQHACAARARSGPVVHDCAQVRSYVRRASVRLPTYARTRERRDFSNEGRASCDLLLIIEHSPGGPCGVLQCARD